MKPDWYSFSPTSSIDNNFLAGNLSDQAKLGKVPFLRNCSYAIYAKLSEPPHYKNRFADYIHLCFLCIKLTPMKLNPASLDFPSQQHHTHVCHPCDSTWLQRNLICCRKSEVTTHLVHMVELWTAWMSKANDWEGGVP